MCLKKKPTPWNLDRAVAMATAIEMYAPSYGYHVALTGGTLYKTGDRKDADFILYEIKKDHPDKDGLFKALSTHGIREVRRVSNWLSKLKTAEGHPMDFMFPDAEEEEGDYTCEETEARIKREFEEHNRGAIMWKTDADGKLIPDSFCIDVVPSIVICEEETG